MARYFKGIKNLRKITWGRTNTWDIKFLPASGGDAPTEPFDVWFPAVSVEEPIFEVQSLDITAHLSTFKVPQGTSALDLRVSFYDNNQHVLLNWIEDWVKVTMFGSTANRFNPQFVATLEECVRKINIIKEDMQGNMVKETNYLVYPDGGVSFRGESEAGVPLYDVNFVIVG